MLATPTAVPLGVNRDDGSEVLLSSDDGPLLIFGTSPGAGASFALKKLFAGLAEGWRSPNSDSVPPLLFSTTASRYKRVADAYGADFISAGPAVWPDDEPFGEQAGGHPAAPEYTRQISGGTTPRNSCTACCWITSTAPPRCSRSLPTTWTTS